MSQVLMLARRERSPDIRRGGFPLSDDGPPAASSSTTLPPSKASAASPETRRVIGPPAVSARQPCARRRPRLLGRAPRRRRGLRARWGRVVGPERSGLPTQPPGPRQDGCRVRRLDASVVAVAASRSPGPRPPQQEFSPRSRLGRRPCRRREPLRAPRATRVLTAQPKRRRCRTGRNEPVGRSRRPVVAPAAIERAIDRPTLEVTGLFDLAPRLKWVARPRSRCA